MNPEADMIARSVADYAIALGDKLTIARCKSFTPEERQKAAARAMMALCLLERDAVVLRDLMPRSAEEGRLMLRDLQEVA